MKIVVYTTTAILISSFAPSGICQQEVPLGVRAIGMGETFVAIADDATAIAWNPAGISQLRHYELSSMYAKLFDLTEVNYLSLAIPISEGKAVGSDWAHNVIGDEEVGFRLDQFDISYGQRIGQLLSVGANLKYLTTLLSLEGGSSSERASGWGSDIGLMLKWPTFRKTSIGFSAKNLIGLQGKGGLARGTSLTFDNGESDVIFPDTYKLGLAYQLNHKWLFGADFGRIFHFGSEYRPHPNLTFRGGIQKDLKNSEDLSYSLGGSIRYKWGEFNYAYVTHPSLPATSLFSVNFNLDLWSLPVEIENIKFRELYPVHQHFYARAYRSTKPLATPGPDQHSPEDFSLQTEDKIGRIWLRNLSSEPLDLKVKVYIDKYTNKGGTEAIQKVHIRPEGRVSVPFERLVLNEEALQLLYAKTVEVKVEVIDLAAESRRKSTASAAVTIQGRNNTKLDDVAKLASFVTSTNRSVREFAEGVIRQGQNQELIKNIKLNQNLIKALLVFNALYGISYAKDPNLPFESGKIDEIKFPAEMLRDMTQYNSKLASDPDFYSASAPLGDCDDTTALFCSLLESIGIRTALIKKAEHVLMAFDLGGISLEQLNFVEGDERISEFYVGVGGYAWIPVETTLIKEGFLKAWLKGIEESKSDVKDSITTQDAWEIYGSVNLMEDWKPEIPSNETVYRKTLDDLNSPPLTTILQKHGGLIR